MASPGTQQRHHPTIEFVLGAISDWINKYRQATGRHDEFGQCDPAEVTRMASDLGVPVSELRTLANKGSASADLLQKMLAALKVDAKDLERCEPSVMRDLQRLCVACGNKRQCQHELANGTAAEHFHEFCPNAFTLDALFDEKAAAAKH